MVSGVVLVKMERILKSPEFPNGGVCGPCDGWNWEEVEGILAYISPGLVSAFTIWMVVSFPEFVNSEEEKKAG